MDVGAIVGLVLLLLIVFASIWNRKDLTRLQKLKNKRRFSGRKLHADEAEELDRLQREYWWH